MINWLRKLLNKKNNDDIKAKLVSPQAINSSHHIESRGLNFTVHRANGGYVIESRIYDSRKDRSINSLHIITDDQQLGDEIAKIITYENLRS